MDQVTADDLIEVAERMSQELQEFLDSAAEAGVKLRSTHDLLEEWSERYAQFQNQDWRAALDDGEVETTWLSDQ